ncbi:hypothetical protein PQX77_019534 [Marasmius sp. AFHP31]|nr:hypothetical protein PQX77_019534 [Marasmius sp. AFHP31]
MAETDTGAILNGFRLHYQQFRDAVNTANSHDNPNVFLFQMLGDDLQLFSEIAAQNQNVFVDTAEYHQLQENIQLMILDMRVMRERAEEATHHGQPPLIQYVSDGGPGRPSIQINRDFLAWAYTERSASGIAHFLGISRRTLRRALLEYGIVQPGEDPFDREESEDEEVEHAHHSDHPQDTPSESLGNDFMALPEVDPEPESGSHQGFSRLSNLSDTDLDNLLLGLRVHFPRAGIKTLQGIRALLEYGIVQPGEDPFDREESEDEEVEHPHHSDHPQDTPSESLGNDFMALPEVDPEPESGSHQGFSRLSNLSDTDLNNLLLALRVHFPRVS